MEDQPTVEDLIELAASHAEVGDNVLPQDDNIDNIDSSDIPDDDTPRPPFVPTTLAEDMTIIREFAEKYSNIRDEIIQTVETKLVFKDKSLEYYHGSFVTLYQIVCMSVQTEEGETTMLAYAMLCTLCKYIVALSAEDKK